MDIDKKPRIGLILLFLSPFILFFLFIRVSSLFNEQRLEQCTWLSDVVVVDNLERYRSRRSPFKYYIYVDAEADRRFPVSRDDYDTIKAGDKLIRKQYFHDDKLVLTVLEFLGGGQLSFRPESSWYVWFP